MAHAIGCRSRALSTKNLVCGNVLRVIFSASAVAQILAYTLDTGLNVARSPHITAYKGYRRRHGEYLLGYISGFPDLCTT
jgi:hypothetical protein